MRTFICDFCLNVSVYVLHVLSLIIFYNYDYKQRAETMISYRTFRGRHAHQRVRNVEIIYSRLPKKSHPTAPTRVELFKLPSKNTSKHPYNEIVKIWVM